jgi:ABC-type glycerol-3-phosphate transport system substrate-binding protein
MSSRKNLRNMSRRDFLKTVGLAAAGASAGSLLPMRGSHTRRAYAQTMLDLYHDKANWTPRVDQLGEAAAEAIDIGFKSVPFPDTTTYQTTVRASLGSDNAPDMFTWWFGFRMEDLVTSGGTEDLTPIWDKYLASGEYSQGIANAYTFDNKVYAVPFNVNYWVLFYNKPLFDDNGLTLPTTWDEFMTLCETLKGMDITPMAQTIADRWQSFIIFEELVARTAGPEFWDDLMHNRAAYTDQKVVDALALWKDLMDKGYFTDPGISMGTAENGMIPQFVQGKVAMLPVGDWYSASLVEAGLESGVGYDAFIMPNVADGLPNMLFFETGPLLVSARGVRKEQAVQVADWWMSAEAQTEWCNLMGFSSPNSQVQLENPAASHVAQQIVDGDYQALQRYWEATPSDIVETAVDELGRFILGGGSAEDVLGAIQDKAESVWESRGG